MTEWAEAAGAIWRAAREAVERTGRGALDFVTRVYEKAGQDNIFFLAGGIAFNVLIAAIPFLLLVVALFGYVLQSTLDNPQQVAVEYVVEVLPASQQLVRWTRNFITDVIDGRTRFGLLGLALFIWTATRLIGSLRTVMRDIFDLQEDRGIVGGKIFDTKMVIVAGTLFLANTAVTVGLEAVRAYGIAWLGLEGRLDTVWRLWAQLLAFGFIFLMFVLIYRYLPDRRIPWRIALVAGTFTAAVFEMMKGGFAWYVANFGNYTSMYGGLATLVVLVFWIYYSSVVFILGGEVAQVYELYRVRRAQRELLE